MSQLKEIVSSDIKKAVIEISANSQAYSPMFMCIFIMIIGAIIELSIGDARVLFGLLIALVIMPLGLMLIAYMFSVLIKLIGAPKQ
jgi:hypothetical protein